MKDYRLESKNFIKTMMDFKSTNYVGLAEKLNVMGIKEDNSNLSNKIKHNS